MNENEIPDAEAWRSLQTECPHCSEIQDIEESDLGRIVPCEVCEKPFIPVE